MTENHTPRERSRVDEAAYRAAKHLRVITDANLAAVVDGAPVETPPPTPRVDVAFPAPDAAKGLVD